MTSNNNNTSTPNAALVPALTVVELYPTKWSSPLDIRPIVSYTSNTDPTNILYITYKVPWNTPIPITNNTSVDTTEVFKTIVSGIP